MPTIQEAIRGMQQKKKEWHSFPAPGGLSHSLLILFQLCPDRVFRCDKQGMNEIRSLLVEYDIAPRAYVGSGSVATSFKLLYKAKMINRLAISRSKVYYGSDEAIKALADLIGKEI